ncbi:MAG: tRNA (adenosine(37)-N6)-threonylcarbamoyltransferase complex dimerization subunit type 1 TsaB [Candidatus Omnitrophica bacterium]|nr:tRNA (adenosine(37)-N6)-threonylcarbamoyltransferase complex dimerization subunit type 1 TsaB [Candidatus Omnitrophota bacterium]
MKLLAIDTSTDYLSLAIINGDKVSAKFHKKAEREHSRLLVPMIDRLLKKTKTKLKDIDGFCVSIGPGSFTGLRIGVTVVKGLGYSLKKPIVAVPTLDAIAQNAKGFCGIICPVLDAKKNKVYACLYRSDTKRIKRISKYLLLPMEGLMDRVKRLKGKIFFLGDMDGLTRKNIDWHPKAEVVAKLGFENFKKKRFVNPEDLEPLYLYSRECDITGR